MEQQRRASLPPIVGRLARWTGVAVGVLLMLPGIYGLVGLGIVLEQWQMCRGMATVPLVAASYPADFCQARDWVAAVLPGVGLLAVGAAGLVMLAASVAGMRRVWQ